MAAARGRQHLEETKLRVQEGQRARTEARIVQLRLTELETRIADLERFRREGGSKSTARWLSFDYAFVSPSFLLCLFVVLSYYVFTSSLRAPTLDTCSSAMICRAFIHAFRIMKKIMNEKGDNSWLATGAPHCNVRVDFIDTATGIKPRDSHLVHVIGSEFESPYW